MPINDDWKVVSNLASDKQAGRISSAIEAQNRVYASALGLEIPSGGASPQDESLPISEEQAKRIADAIETSLRRIPEVKFHMCSWRSVSFLSI